MIQIAHRGLSEDCIDNSKEAFEKAIQNGFDMIELDIQLSKDDIIFVYHDTFIQGFLLKNCTFQEILQMDKNILSLVDFFTMVKSFDIKIYLDLKGYGEDICDKLDFILKEILDKEYISKNVYIGSFNIKNIEKLHLMNEGYNLGVITENLFPTSIIQHMLQMYDIRFFSFHWTVLDDNISNYLKENGIEIFTYTNKSDNILKFIRQKKCIDGIVTNYMIQDE